MPPEAPPAVVPKKQAVAAKSSHSLDATESRIPPTTADMELEELGMGKGESGVVDVGRGTAVDGVDEEVKQQEVPKLRAKTSSQQLSSVDGVDLQLDPTLVNIFDPRNLALPFSYFSVGFAQSFILTPALVYLVHHLDASPAATNILTTVIALPPSFRLVFGLLSDCVPIGGRRRKPYFIAGWAIHILANAFLVMLHEPSIQAIIALTCLFTVGYVVVWVVSDAMVAERSKLEAKGNEGSMQGVAWTCNSSGLVLGAVLGSVLYNRGEWGWGVNIQGIFAINGVLPLVLVLPFLHTLYDPVFTSQPPSLTDQLHHMWWLATRTNVHRPMAFLVLFNVLIMPIAAMNNFWILTQGFNSWQIGMMPVGATGFTWLGILAYRAYVHRLGWRAAFILGTIWYQVFFAGQIVVIVGATDRWGVPVVPWAVIDGGLGKFAWALQVLPSMTFFLQLCPEGGEGTTFALCTTLTNVAMLVGLNISTLFSLIWDVGNGVLENHDVSGLWRLSVLTNAIQPLSLLLLPLLPRNVEEQKDRLKSDSHSSYGGFALLAFLVVAWVWTVSEMAVFVSLGK